VKYCCLFWFVLILGITIHQGWDRSFKNLCVHQIQKYHHTYLQWCPRGRHPGTPYRRRTPGFYSSSVGSCRTTYSLLHSWLKQISTTYSLLHSWLKQISTTYSLLHSWLKQISPFYNFLLINISTEHMKLRPMLQQMQGNTLRQTLHLHKANNTQKTQSSDWPKWQNNLQERRIRVVSNYLYYISVKIVLLYAIYHPLALFCHILCYSYNARSTCRYLHQVRTG